MILQGNVGSSNSMEKYYIQYLSVTGEDLNVEDNQERREIQTVRTSNGYLVYQTYISCPIEEYEFYVNGELINLKCAL